MALLTPWPPASRLQSHETTPLRRVSHPACGARSGSPGKDARVGPERGRLCRWVRSPVPSTPSVTVPRRAPVETLSPSRSFQRRKSSGVGPLLGTGRGGSLLERAAPRPLRSRLGLSPRVTPGRLVFRREELRLLPRPLLGVFLLVTTWKCHSKGPPLRGSHACR